ncbi:MAG: cytochrome c biogenesis CcdA family protein, partial [Dehalococcoidia bacterium]
GMVAAVNPCGFPMLPVYLGLYLRGSGDTSAAPGGRRPLGQALAVGGTVTAGFVVLFATVGLAIALGAQVLVTVFPWIGLGVGIAMIAAGAWLLGGRTLYSALGERAGAHVGDPSRGGARGYLLFGVSYGVASLSCTLPIFLSVAGGSIAAADPLVALGRFILYGLGMGSVIIALTVSMALFKAGLVSRMRRVQRYVEPAGAVLALAAGTYITYYWLTLGGLMADLT